MGWEYMDWLACMSVYRERYVELDNPLLYDSVCFKGGLMSKILISNAYLEAVFIPRSWAVPLFVCYSRKALTVQIFCLWMGFEFESIGKYLKEFMED